MHEQFVGTGDVVLYDEDGECWRLFLRPYRTVVAESPDQVMNALSHVEQAVERDNAWAAGFVAYEAAPAFMPKCKVGGQPSLPLAWFGLYERSETLPSLRELVSFGGHGRKDASQGDSSCSRCEASSEAELDWRASVDRRAYGEAIRRIKHYIEIGDTYQVNYTLRLRASFDRDPWPYFLRLVRAQEKSYGCYVDLGRFAICSASPELFFRQRGSRIVSRPMKGTAARGLTLADDRRRAAALADSAKDRAENLMIVDMIRNDLGRVAVPGSVCVPELFNVEKYPTVWQMTSTVEAETRAGFASIFGALFPCASITGAPKIRTMEIIAELETLPRGMYTGAMGFLAPSRKAQFNVAIRTVVIDRERGEAEYGVGGGIVWDSGEESEFEECCTKARVLGHAPPEFSLLESLLWEPTQAFHLLDEHLIRLRESAEYFSFFVDVDGVQQALKDATVDLPPMPHKVRLLVDAGGAAKVEVSVLGEPSPQPLRVCLAREAVDSSNVFLYHKTTHRAVYDHARHGGPADCDDVLLWNERGEMTESCIANIVVELEGRRYTPPVRCGLLAGTCRNWMLARGVVHEKVIHKDELARCTGLWLVNSVRGERSAVLI